MKSMLLLILTISLSTPTAFAYTTNGRATTGSPAATGSTTGSYGSEAAPVNDTVGSDSVGSTQSSTTRRDTTMKSNRKTAPYANCIDRTGRTYGSTDAGYSACRSTMKTTK
jgi:hypothetical protein